jgi:hypothetical protein
MHLRLTLSLFDFLFCHLVHLVQDHKELLDGFCWLSCELVWGPSELFAEAEFCEGFVWLLSSDCSDKKAVSSFDTLQSRFVTLLSNSPSPTLTPSVSLSSFARVMGSFLGCSFRLAQIVSACIATKSLLSTWPDTLLYLVYFWMIRLRLAQGISLKT